MAERGNHHVDDGQVGGGIDLEDLRVDLPLEVAAHVPVGVVGHVDHRALGGTAAVLQGQFVLGVQEEGHRHLAMRESRCAYSHLTRVVLIAVGRDDCHLHANGVGRLQLFELPHLLAMKTGKKVNVAPAHLSSVQTVRTVVDAHLVVHSVQSELATGDTVRISTCHVRFIAENLPTVAPLNTPALARRSSMVL